MIGRIRGVLLEKRPPYLLLDVHGVGYELEAPMTTFYGLPVLGNEVSLFTHLVVREDAQLLFGFATEIKQAIVGRGNAAKAQVQHMIKVLLCLNETPQADAADALAIALGHGYRRQGLLRMARVRGSRGGRLL